MLVKQSTIDPILEVELLDCGLLWKDADRLTAHEIIIVDHTIEKQSSAREISLIVVKACYLVVLNIRIKEGRNPSSDVIGHVVFGTGPSNIVSVQSISKTNDRENFIVACREGPLHILTLPSDDVLSASIVSVELSEIFFKNAEAGSVDTKNYRCHGFKKSKNSSVWVFLQNGLLDEQVKFSKGKLTFLTQQTFSSISKTIFKESSVAQTFGISSVKDSLEVYRILACIQSKDKKNEDDSFSRQFIELIRSDLKTCRESDTIRTETMQLYLWMCQLFGTLSNSDEMIRNWDCISDDLHRDILCLHALQVLRKYMASDPRFNSKIYDISAISSLRSFYLNFSTGDKEEVMRLNIPKYIWNCKICCNSGTPVSNDDSYTDCFYCEENNHRWPRCVITLKICDETSLLKCKWCECNALSFPTLDYTSVNCSLCKGPFIL
jgi:hypothetical protein